MYTLNNIKIIIADSYEQMSIDAAEIFLRQLSDKNDSIMGLATGGTPVGMYKELIKKYNEGTVCFSKMHAFNLDEYYPIKKTNDQSYDYFMKDNLFNHININFDNIDIPNGEADDPEKECDRYEQKIIEKGGIDFQLLGIGLNGHIGFNEPTEAFSSKTNCVNLQESTIKANARFFETEEQVPRKAISMGIKTIMMAKKIMLICSGANKADIIKKTIFGPITPMVPASVLQMHRDVTFVLDREAAVDIESFL